MHPLALQVPSLSMPACTHSTHTAPNMPQNSATTRRYQSFRYQSFHIRIRVPHSVREFIASEALAALGVPTTRALSLVTTGAKVLRDMFYKCATTAASDSFGVCCCSCWLAACALRRMACSLTCHQRRLWPRLNLPLTKRSVGAHLLGLATPPSVSCSRTKHFPI